MNIIDTINSGAFNQVSIVHTELDTWRNTRLQWMKFGFKNWAIDYCIQTGPIKSDEHVTAVLAFNFDIIPGFQYELLYWRPIVHYPHDIRSGGVSHMAYYTQNVEADVKDIQDHFGVEPWYKFVTLDHSNPYLHGKTRFKEAMWDLNDHIGMNIKAVQKIGWDSDESWD
jgi:hypothetical protein